MYSPSMNWIEQIKQIAHEVSNSKIFVLEGIVTSIDPNPPYKVKVTLEPYAIESGWLKVATPYVGNNCGLIFPAPPEGTAVKVIFDLGDLSNGTVISSVFNDSITMPNVTYGTAGLVHSSGSSFLLNQDGSITVQAKGGAKLTLSNDGSLSLNGGVGGSISIATDKTVSITGKNSSASW